MGIDARTDLKVYVSCIIIGLILALIGFSWIWRTSPEIFQRFLPIISVVGVLVVISAIVNLLVFNQKIKKDPTDHIMKIHSYFQRQNIEPGIMSIHEKDEQGRPLSFKVETNKGSLLVTFKKRKIVEVKSIGRGTQ